MWTHFWDMSSGGGHKEPFGHIYIEAPQDEAISVFYSRFGHNPHRVSCTCCGSDYSISEGESLEELTAYHRGCSFNKKGYNLDDAKISLAKYIRDKDVHVIRASTIKAHERTADVPDEGYVWI